jgi:ribosomal protein L16 Arg81 hydroxylase
MQLSFGIYYPTYVNSSKCFERYVAHHQEPQLYLVLSEWELRQHQGRIPQAFVNQRLKYS